MRSPFLAAAGAIHHGAAASALIGLLLLTGCGGPKGFYAGANARAERAAAEAATAPAADATLQTQTTYVRLVEQMQRDGLWFASLAHLDALEQRWGTSPVATRLRADALRQTGQPAESRRQYTLLLNTPLAGAGYHGLGLLAGADNDFAAAIQSLIQAQQRDPIDAVVLSDLGYANMRAGRMDSARVPLMQAAQLLPDNPQVQANLALYLAANRQGEQAEAVMAAQRLAPAIREAVRQAAIELKAVATPITQAPMTSPSVASSASVASATSNETTDTATPQAVHATARTRRVHVMLRGPAAGALRAPALSDTAVATAAAAVVLHPSGESKVAMQPSTRATLPAELTASTKIPAISAEGSP